MGDCVVCEEKSYYQKFLSCGGENGRHKLCESCVRKMAKLASDQAPNGDKIIECPLCRTTTTLPDGDVTKLETKFLVELLCEDCSERKKLEEQWWCKTCETTICSTCGMKRHRPHDCSLWENYDVPKECISFFKSRLVKTDNTDDIQKVKRFCQLLETNLINKLNGDGDERYANVVRNMERSFGRLEAAANENGVTNFEKKLNAISVLCKSMNPLFQMDIKTLLENAQQNQVSVSNRWIVNEVIRFIHKFQSGDGTFGISPPAAKRFISPSTKASSEESRPFSFGDIFVGTPPVQGDSASTSQSSNPSNPFTFRTQMQSAVTQHVRLPINVSQRQRTFRSLVPSTVVSPSQSGSLSSDNRFTSVGQIRIDTPAATSSPAIFGFPSTQFNSPVVFQFSNVPQPNETSPQTPQ